MEVANYSGQDQEIHYFDKTEIVKQGENHTIDMKRIGRPEMTRIVNIFTEIKKEKKADVKTVNQSRPMVKGGE